MAISDHYKGKDFIREELEVETRMGRRPVYEEEYCQELPVLADIKINRCIKGSTI
jgi:hypothetical protein